MTLFEKGIFFLVIAGFIVVNIFNITTEYSGPRTILIKKENYSKDIDSVTHDSLVNKSPYKTYVTFHVKVKAKTFWDRMLLTNEDGNLMSELFKIATALAAGWFIYQLQPGNIFSNRSFNIIWLAIGMFVGILLASSIGADHTKDFWRDYSISKGGKESDGYDLFGDARISWVYYWTIFPLAWLYRALKEKHQEKLKLEKKSGDDFSTAN